MPRLHVAAFHRCLATFRKLWRLIIKRRGAAAVTGQAAGAEAATAPAATTATPDPEYAAPKTTKR